MSDFLKKILVGACGAVAFHHSCVFAQVAKPSAGTTVVGAGVAYVPGYYGSRDKVLVPAVFAEHTFRNGMFLSTLRGIGFDTTVSNIELGAALRYASGRTDSRNTIATHSGSDDLRGMGDVPNYLATDLHAYVPLGDTVTATVTAQLALNHRDTNLRASKVQVFSYEEP